MKGRILIVSYWFPPFQTIGATRVASFAKYLNRLGWQVAVVTVTDSQLAHDGLRSGFDGASDLEICRVPGASIACSLRALSGGGLKGSGESAALKRQKGALRRFVSYVYKNVLTFPDECWPWRLLGARAAVRFAKRFQPDLVFSSALPASSHLIAARIQHELQIPWVAEYRDLWTGHMMRERSLFWERLNASVETRAMRGVDLLVSVSQPLCDVLSSLHQKPVAVIQNGYDPSEFSSSSEVANDKLTLIYTGMVYDRVQQPEILFEAFAVLANSDGIDSNRLLFKYYGPNSDLFSRLANEYSVGHLCEINGSVARNEVLREQQRADVLVFFSFSEEGWLSGKIFEYLGAGRNVLSIGPNDRYVSSLLNETQSGLLAHDADDVVQQLRVWLDERDSNGNITYSGNELRQRYTRQGMAETLSSHFERLISSSSDQNGAIGK